MVDIIEGDYFSSGKPQFAYVSEGTCRLLLSPSLARAEEWLTEVSMHQGVGASQLRYVVSGCSAKDILGVSPDEVTA